MVAGRVGQRYEYGRYPANADLRDDPCAGTGDDQVAGGVERFDFVRVFRLEVSRPLFIGEVESLKSVQGVGFGVVIRASGLSDYVDDVDILPGQQAGQRVDHGPVDGTGARRSAKGENNLRVGRKPQ